MDIYRHNVNNLEFLYEDSAYLGNFAKMLTNLGFTQLDGKDIRIPTSYGDDQALKWGVDSTASVYITYRPGAFENTNRIAFNLPFGGGAFQSNDKLITSDAIINNNFQVIFIPLKNNGFLLECVGNDRGAYLNNIAPKFKTYSYQGDALFQRNGGVETSETATRVTYLIGIPNNFSSTNSYNYLYLDSGQRNSGLSISTIQAYVNIMIDGSLKGGIPNVDTSANLDYVNKNKNICTLIPYPYENQFIDGLYLATTIPDETIEGKFFSFEGRNFLGIYQNLIVELPAN